MNLKELQKKYILEPYKAISEVYTAKHFDEEIFNKPLADFTAALTTGKKVLDIGCGPGGETKKLLESGLDVTSIDISDIMLTKAKELVPNGKFINMDVTKMTFATDEFDGVWCARTLIHIPSVNLPGALGEIRHVLKAEGVFGGIVLEGDSEGVEPEYYDPTGKTSCFFKYFRVGELDTLLVTAGFKIVKSYSPDEDAEEPHLFVLAKKVSE